MTDKSWKGRLFHGVASLFDGEESFLDSLTREVLKRVAAAGYVLVPEDDPPPVLLNALRVIGVTPVRFWT